MFKLTVTVEPAFAAPAAAGYAAAAAAAAYEWPRCCVICGANLGRLNVFPTCGVCYNAAMKKQSDNKDGEDKADAVGNNKDGNNKDGEDKDKTLNNMQTADR